MPPDPWSVLQYVHSAQTPPPPWVNSRKKPCKGISFTSPWSQQYILLNRESCSHHKPMVAAVYTAIPGRAVAFTSPWSQQCILLYQGEQWPSQAHGLSSVYCSTRESCSLHKPMVSAVYTALPGRAVAFTSPWSQQCILLYQGEQYPSQAHGLSSVYYSTRESSSLHKPMVSAVYTALPGRAVAFTSPWSQQCLLLYQGEQ